MIASQGLSPGQNKVRARAVAGQCSGQDQGKGQGWGWLDVRMWFPGKVSGGCWMIVVVAADCIVDGLFAVCNYAINHCAP